MPTPARQIVSTLNADATITIEVRETELPDPGPKQVVVALEAAPINPSDIAGLFGPADLANAEYTPGCIVAPVPEAAMKALGRALDAATQIELRAADQLPSTKGKI